MQRQGSASGLARRCKAKSRGSMVRFLWFSGYLSVSLAALLSTFLFPDLLYILRQRHPYPQPYLLSKIKPYQNLRQSDLGMQSRIGELSWKQEVVPPHLSRSKNLDVHIHHSELDEKLWSPPPNRGFVPCVEASPAYRGPVKTRGYLLVQSNGGLNQMRAGICDMVAVARILNATLVVPELDKRSFWQDSSNFSDIFDVDYFIKALKGDVHVVKRLPKNLVSAPKAIRQFRSWSRVKYYEDEIARLWQDHKVIRAAKSDSRLANNHMPSDIQKLRCRVHYDALRFAPQIEAFGKKLVEKMRSDGPYIALHLRYEKDMLAFSGCTYGLTQVEADELAKIRMNTAHWKVKKINSTDQRIRGFCPLTPAEVGIFLRALGYPESTRIYVAAGEIYGGNERMAGLLSRFPNVMSKETIATFEELEPFAKHASQMAALDYIVSVESDVFVPSYSGNMAHAVEGHRRYFGHRKTISPDRKELVTLFDMLDRGELQEGWQVAESITEIHQWRQGAPRKRKGPMKGTKGRDRLRTEEAFYTNPLPDCLCSQPSPLEISKHLRSPPTRAPFKTNLQILQTNGSRGGGMVGLAQRQ